MTALPFYTASGWLTWYGLACGYIERKRIGNLQTELWMEHGCIHVRQHEFDGRGRIFWDVFDRNLNQARKRFKTA